MRALQMVCEALLELHTHVYCRLKLKPSFSPCAGTAISCAGGRSGDTTSCIFILVWLLLSFTRRPHLLDYVVAELHGRYIWFIMH